jgi:hypothetical protein
MGKWLGVIFCVCAAAVVVDDLRAGGIFPDGLYCAVGAGKSGKKIVEDHPAYLLAMLGLAFVGLDPKDVESLSAENACWHNSILAAFLNKDPLPPRSFMNRVKILTEGAKWEKWGGFK